MIAHISKTLTNCLPKSIFLLLVLVCFIDVAHAQGPPKGMVEGTVVDSMTGTPIEFASVALIRRSDSSLVTGGITDAAGKIRLEGVPFGRYTLRINFMGYKTLKRRVQLNKDQSEVRLGSLQLPPNVEIIEGAEVVAERSFMESGIDRKVYNVDQLETNKGASAEEVMQTIPSVEVDLEGNISLRGSENVTVLVDGKPSTLTGGSRQAILAQIPADAIERIEVITNPSAKFDPDGMAGIINIVMKKNRKDGLNGSVSLGVGSRHKYNGNLGIAYKTGKINLSANYSYRYNLRFRSGKTYRETFFTDSTAVLDQYSYADRTGQSHSPSMAIDIDLNKYNTLSASAGVQFSNSSSEDSIQYLYLDNAENLSSKSYRFSNEDGNEFNYNALLRYRKTFKQKGRELVADISYSEGFETESEGNESLFYTSDGAFIDGDPVLQNTYTDQNNRFAVGQLDYVHPFKNGMKVETGAKSTIRKFDNAFNSESYNAAWQGLVSDSLLNNRFVYEEDIHAIYGIVSQTKDKWGYQLGLRLEQAFTTSTLEYTNEEFKNDYFSAFPSVHIAYERTETSEFQVSYSRRIDRPSLRSLNPFYDYNDPLNLRFGNPFLKPEYIDSYELGYLHRWKKTTLTSSIYYKLTHDQVRRIRTVDNTTGISTTTFQNLDNNTNYGLEFILSGSLGEKWTYNGSANAYYIRLEGSTNEVDLSNDGYAASFKLSTFGSINKLWDLQLSGFFRTPRPHSQGYVRAMYSGDIAIKRSILKKKGSLSLRLTDVANTRRFSFDSSGNDFTQESTFQRESRVLTFNFSYRFGKQTKRGKGGGGRGSSGGGGGDDDL